MSYQAATDKATRMGDTCIAGLKERGQKKKSEMEPYDGNTSCATSEVKLGQTM